PGSAGRPLTPHFTAVRRGIATTVFGAGAAVFDTSAAVLDAQCRSDSPIRVASEIENHYHYQCRVASGTLGRRVMPGGWRGRAATAVSAAASLVTMLAVSLLA